MLSPLISVILPVYNASAYLHEAINSILNQTLNDFEMLVYNDGSTDDSDAIIRAFSDPRIRYRQFDKNQGLIQVLNTGIDDARGAYIARMDADDVAHPDRFRLQLEYMQTHPDCGVCGTQIRVIGSGEIIRKPCSDAELRWWIFKGSPLAHPSVMLRSSVLKEHKFYYSNDAYTAEDFDLWWRMAIYTKMGNLPEVLLDYRVHPQQVSTAKVDIQSNKHQEVLIRFIQTLGLDSSVYPPDFIHRLLSRDLEANSTTFMKVWQFFNSLIHAETARQFFGLASILDQRHSQLQFLLKNIENYHFRLLPLIVKSGFINLLDEAGIAISKFIIKSLLCWKTNNRTKSV